MAWDMNDMGGVMFVPVVFCLHMLLICLGTFSGGHGALYTACWFMTAAATGLPAAVLLLPALAGI
jgi:hypothetical protein